MKMCKACTRAPYTFPCDLAFVRSKNHLFRPYMCSPVCSSSNVHALSLNGDKLLQKEKALINPNYTQPIKQHFN